MRVLVGACELAGAIGLLVHRLRAWAALGLLVLLISATVTNIAVLDTSPLALVGPRRDVRRRTRAETR